MRPPGHRLAAFGGHPAATVFSQPDGLFAHGNELKNGNEDIPDVVSDDGIPEVAALVAVAVRTVMGAALRRWRKMPPPPDAGDVSQWLKVCNPQSRTSAP